MSESVETPYGHMQITIGREFNSTETANTFETFCSFLTKVNGAELFMTALKLLKTMNVQNTKATAESYVTKNRREI